MHYLPYGEEWIDQQSTSWNAPYTFTGKIKDAETGYNYFGARYYDSQLSVWLSVDPLSDKYPSLSPYTYCANNPVMMVDPDGRAIINYYTAVVSFYQSRLNALNHKLFYYSGDKNSEEYKEIVSNRNTHKAYFDEAKDLEIKVHDMINKFRDVMPDSYWNKVNNLTDKHGKSVDLVIKFNSNLDPKIRGLFYSATDGESFYGTWSDDLYTDMMQGHREAPTKRSEQLIEIRKFWDVAALAHEFGHAFYNVTNPVKNLEFNQRIPPECRDGHQYSNPSGSEANHWERAFNGKDDFKY
jgi:RHS repeat-associated protein